MLVNKAYRYELKPNKSQLVLLKKHAGCARFAWNWGLAERKRLWEEEGKSTNAIEQHRELNRLKKTDSPWMYEVSKCAPQEALRDLDRAFKNFFEGRSNFPKFKKKGIHDSFRLTGTIKMFSKHVQLPRLGKIRAISDGCWSTKPNGTAPDWWWCRGSSPPAGGAANAAMSCRS